MVRLGYAACSQFRIDSVAVDANTNLVVSMTASRINSDGTFESLTDPIFNVIDQSGNVVTGSTPGEVGPNGTGSGSSFTFAVNTNNYAEHKQGANGGNGAHGGGVRFCIRWIGCYTVGKSPTKGGSGAAGPTITRVVNNSGVSGPDFTSVNYSSPGPIGTVSDDLAGVIVSSRGGNGGAGGNGYGVNIQGATHVAKPRKVAK